MFINQIYIFIDTYVEEDFLHTRYDESSNFILMSKEFISKSEIYNFTNKKKANLIIVLRYTFMCNEIIY